MCAHSLRALPLMVFVKNLATVHGFNRISLEKQSSGGSVRVSTVYRCVSSFRSRFVDYRKCFGPSYKSGRDVSTTVLIACLSLECWFSLLPI